MGTYKVLQDIEAEDKILGPLTLKQFVFGGITVAIGGIGFFVAQATHPAVFVLFLVPMIPFGFLAAPLGRDQPNDVWLAAKLRFMFKPKVRVWNQTGLQELVTITVPKKIEHVYTDGLGRDQVRSRLTALANTVDSRGWATKNVNLNLSAAGTSVLSDDRLIKPTEMPQEVSEVDVRAEDDILDNNASPVSQNFQQLIDTKTEETKQTAIANMQAAAARVANQTQPTQATNITTQQTPAVPQQPMATQGVQPTAPIPASVDEDAEAFLENLHKKQARFSGPVQIDTTEAENNIMPGHQPAQPQTVDQQTVQQAQIIGTEDLPAVIPDSVQAEEEKILPEPVVTAPDAGILKELAENDDFKISTIAAQANKKIDDSLHDEEVINLH